MLTRTSNFLDDSTGIEKTLRLAQGFFTVLAGLAVSAEAAAPWSLAKSQVNLGRRYLRLHKWHPCFRSAFAQYTRSELGSVEKMLEVAKWSFLGLYFLMEMPTITNAMSITSYDWATQLQHEALKFWFYGISVSIVLGYYQLIIFYFHSNKPTSDAKADEKGKEKKLQAEKAAAELKRREAELSATWERISIQLVIDCCDIFLPGSAVGWIAVGPVFVGACQSLSSMLAMRQIWRKVNAAE